MKSYKTVILSVDEMKDLVVKYYKEVLPSITKIDFTSKILALSNEDILDFFVKLKINKEFANQNKAEYLIVEGIGEKPITFDFTKKEILTEEQKKCDEINKKAIEEELEKLKSTVLGYVSYSEELRKTKEEIRHSLIAEVNKLLDEYLNTNGTYLRKSRTTKLVCTWGNK